MLTDTDIAECAKHVMDILASYFEENFTNIEIIYQYKIKEFDAPNVLIKVSVLDANYNQLEGIKKYCQQCNYEWIIKHMIPSGQKNIKQVQVLTDNSPHGSRDEKLQYSGTETLYYRPDYEMIGFETKVIERNSKKEKEQADKSMKELEERKEKFKAEMKKKHKK